MYFINYDFLYNLAGGVYTKISESENYKSIDINDIIKIIKNKINQYDLNENIDEYFEFLFYDVLDEFEYIENNFNDELLNEALGESIWKALLFTKHPILTTKINNNIKKYITNQKKLIDLETKNEVQGVNLEKTKDAAIQKLIKQAQDETGDKTISEYDLKTSGKNDEKLSKFIREYDIITKKYKDDKQNLEKRYEITKKTLTKLIDSILDRLYKLADSANDDIVKSYKDYLVYKADIKLLTDKLNQIEDPEVEKRLKKEIEKLKQDTAKIEDEIQKKYKDEEKKEKKESESKKKEGDEQKSDKKNESITMNEKYEKIYEVHKEDIDKLISDLKDIAYELQEIENDILNYKNKFLSTSDVELREKYKSKLIKLNKEKKYFQEKYTKKEKELSKLHWIEDREVGFFDE